MRMTVGLLVMLIGLTVVLITFNKFPGFRAEGPGLKLTFVGFGQGGGDGLGDPDDLVRDESLRLSGLSGPPARRLAIVNNQTFQAGETARIEVRGKKVKVRCDEIRARSAVVQVEGLPVPIELFLGRPLPGMPASPPTTAERARAAAGAHVPAGPPAGTNRVEPALPVEIADVEVDRERLKALGRERRTNGLLVPLEGLEKSVENLVGGAKNEPGR
jgi:hypothetical protein